MSRQLTYIYVDLIPTSSHCRHALRFVKPLAKCSLLPALLRQIVSKMSLCTYVYTCVCVECVCVHASRAVLFIFLTPRLCSYNRPISSSLTWCPTHEPTQSISHLRQRRMYQGLADGEKLTYIREKEFSDSLRKTITYLKCWRNVTSLTPLVFLFLK